MDRPRASGRGRVGGSRDRATCSGPDLRRVSVLVILICCCSLTAHWAFMFWSQQHLYNLPDLADRPEDEKRRLVSLAMLLVMIASIAGNFVAAWLAHRLGDRRTIALMCLGYFLVMVGDLRDGPRDHVSTDRPAAAHQCLLGVLRALHDVLAAAVPHPAAHHGRRLLLQHRPHRLGVGTVVFGLISVVNDYRIALLARRLPVSARGAARPRAPGTGRQRDDSSIEAQPQTRHLRPSTHREQPDDRREHATDAARSRRSSGVHSRNSSSSVRRNFQSLVSWLSRSKSALLM